MKISRFTHRLANLSIRNKLVITFLTITTIPLIALGYLSNQSSRQALTEAARNSLLSLASQTATSIDTFLISNLETIRIEAQLPVFRNFLSLPPAERATSALQAEALETLFDLHATHRQENASDSAYFQGFSLLDNSGAIVLDTHLPPDSENPRLELDWSGRDIFSVPFTQNRAFSSPVEVPEDTDFPSIYFAAPITAGEGQPIGVLVARYNANALQDIIAAKNGLAGEGSFGVLFDENLIHLAHGADPRLIFTLVAPINEEALTRLQRAGRLPARPAADLILNLPDLEAGLKNDETHFSAKDPATGDLVNQVAVVPLESVAWKVAFFQPEEIFLAPAAQQTANIVLFSGLIIILTVGSAILAAQGMATPIKNLIAASEEIAAGNLQVRAEVATQDEIGVLARTFNSMADQLQKTLTDMEQRIEERTNLLEVSAEIGRAASSILDPERLISRVVHLIGERFGYYYTAIFLVDETGEWAELKDATGEAGQLLKARQHRLKVGGASMVGSAIATRQGRIALDVDDATVRFANPLLPLTRSEIALPLLAGDRAIGALDVQSTKEAAFSEHDIDTLQNMANQVAIAIQNARLYQQQQQQLEEITRLNRFIMRQNWQSYQESARFTFQYKDNRLVQLPAPEIPHVKDAVEQQEPVYSQKDGKAALTLPIVLRGNFLGVLHLQSSQPEWSKDELTIIDSVLQQAALALENARLITETQQRAEQEKMVSEITTRIRQTLDLETILQTTAHEVRQALQLAEVEVQILPETPGASGESKAGPPTGA